MIPRVYKIAQDLRETIEGAKRADADIVWLPRFPEDCCNYVANLLLFDLSSKGIKRLRRMIGAVNDKDKHVWVRAGELVVDITADQFGQPTVIVSRDSGWHDALSDIKPYVLQHNGCEEGISEAEIERLRNSDSYREMLAVLGLFRQSE